MPRLRTLVVLTALAVGLSAAPALAHVQVATTSPKRGKTVKRPASASVTFNGPIRRGTIRVVGPAGRAASGTGGQDPRDVTRLLVELKPGLKSGTYTVKWTCVSADGHAQHGSFTFKVKR
jgi:methionine-rich copper-binding protein CopC